MKKSFLTILFFTVLTTYGQMNESYLFRIGDDELSEIGTSCGYVNSKGDTVIAVGQFRFCYTDTIRYIGIVLDTSFQCKAIDNKGKYLYDVKWFENGHFALFCVHHHL